MSQSPSEPTAPGNGRKPDSLARRVRLREFQSQLLERMQAARTGAATGRNQLGVMIGRQRWLLDLKAAGEIVQVEAIASVPLTRPWFLGLINIRGNLVSVIDFSSFQGLEPLEIDKESRIVSLSPGLSVNSGLLVSRVMGLRNAEEMEPAPGISDNGCWANASYIDRDGERWAELDLARVVQDPQFLQIGI
jgi:twitching motility protein PilI